MQISRPATIAQFLSLASPYLAAHEAEHGLLLGVAAAVITPAPEAYWALVILNEQVVGAALRTGAGLILSREGATGAMQRLALDAASPHLHRILGPPPSVRVVADTLGYFPDLVMEQGIYECRQVLPTGRAPGFRRVASPTDCETLAHWVQHLSLEALSETVSLDEARDRVLGHIARGAMHVWDHGGQPVAQAAAVAPTLHGVRINNVYTPPELRGRGYAGALVGSLTQHALDSGRQFTFLHTDLGNPTTNRLYMRLGYRHIADFYVRQRQFEA